MFNAMKDAAPPPATCANCGATVAGAYCATCGQSRDALDRGFVALLLEQVGDIFSWDGRLATTLRELYMRPGRVAREYVEGRRASHTPPVRMLLLASLALFAVMSAFGLRIVAVAVDSGVTPAGEETPLLPRTGVTISFGDDAEVENGTAWAVVRVTLFGGDQASRLTPAPPELIETLLADAGDRDWKFIYDAFRNPAGLELAVNAAATQALFSMVAVFALLNLLLHPRRRFLLHATHALYFHAALALAYAGWIVIWRLTALSATWAALVALIVFVLAAIAFDRGCYRSSALGLGLRIPVLVVFYWIGLALVMTGFTLLLIPH